MKILYVCGYSKYGTFTLSRDLVDIWLRHGYEVALVACVPDELVGYVRQHKIPVYFIPSARTFHLNQAFRLAAIARKEKADILHACHLLAGRFLCSIAALLSGRPLVFYIGTPCNIYNRYRIVRWVQKFLQRWTMGMATGVISMSHFLSDQLRSEAKISGGVEIAVIPHGVDPSLIRKKNNPSVPTPYSQSRSFRAIHVARLAPEKAQDLVLRALKDVNRMGCQLSVDFIGDESSLGYTVYLARLKKELRLPEGSVNFLGYQPLSRIYQILSEYDLFLHPSREEGQGIAVLEAMAAGLPVIASAAGGLKEMVVHGETGFLVEVDDYLGLGRAIVSLLQDNEKRLQMGEAGRQRLLEHFALDKTETKFIEFYERKFGRSFCTHFVTRT